MAASYSVFACYRATAPLETSQQLQIGAQHSLVGSNAHSTFTTLGRPLPVDAQKRFSASSNIASKTFWPDIHQHATRRPMKCIIRRPTALAYVRNT